MSKTKTLEVTVTWEASSGRKYEVPLEVDICYDANYGEDYDGNRGCAGWEFEDFRLVGKNTKVSDIITDEADEEEFFLDALSEDAFEKALERMAS